jgi:hypothetical protein
MVPEEGHFIFHFLTIYVNNKVEAVQKSLHIKNINIIN